MRWLCTGAILLWALSAWAEVPRMGVAVGTVTMEGKQWQRISFRPDIPIGPFGVALDIELFLDQKGNISKRGWDFSTGQATRETIFRKIYYVRYGRQGKPVFMKLGALDDVTLGYGLIVDGYTNALEYPSVKRIGFQGDVRLGGGLRLQWVVNDLDDAFTGGPWFAARASAPLLGKLRVGGTLAMDINQFAGLKDRDGDDVPDALDPFPDDGTAWTNTDADSDFPDEIPDYKVVKGDTVWVDTLDINGDNIYDRGEYRNLRGPEPFKKSENKDRITVVGVDLGYPILEGPVKLELYGQAAKFLMVEDGGGWGFAAPGLRLTAGPLRARLEYRNFQGRFRPEYFNDMYELERARVVGDSAVTKEAGLDSVSLKGVFGKAVLRVMNIVSVRASYQYLSGKERNQRFYVDGRALEPLLRQVPRLGELSAYYHKDHIDTREAGFFDPTPNTIYGYRIGFKVGDGVQLVWHTHYEYTGTAKNPKRHKYVTVETEVKF